MKPSHWSDLPMIETGRGVVAPIFRLYPDPPCDPSGCHCIVPDTGILVSDRLSEDGPYLDLALCQGW